MSRFALHDAHLPVQIEVCYLTFSWLVDQSEADLHDAAWTQINQIDASSVAI